MKRLVLIAHAVKDLEPAYADALSAFGQVAVKAFISPHPGQSSAYISLANTLRNGGRILPQLVAAYAAGRWDSIVLVTWSAGYALARELLLIKADADELDAVVLLDSLHCSADALARDRQLAPFATYARRAQAGEKVLFVGHSDVPVSDYYSTTRAARALVELTGEPRGGFIVRAYDTVPGKTVADYQQEHRNAVRLWGPSATAEAVGKLASFEAGPDTDKTPPRAFTPMNFALDVGLAVLAIAKQDLDAGIQEVGHNAGADIERLYLQPLGLPRGSSYCAAAVTSWIRRAERAYGVRVPIVGSAGAKAIMAELQRVGLWTPAAKMKRDDVRPGCLLVWDRSTAGKPDTSWMGHVGIVVDVGEAVAFCIEANADRPPPCDAVCMTERRLDDARLLGVGSLSPAPLNVA